MSFIAAAVIGGGAALAGGAMAASASRSAAGTQARSAAEANAIQQQQFERTNELQEPFRQTGLSANNRLAEMLGLDRFDGAAYLRANPDIAADPYFAQHPEEHYQKYGQYESRQAPNMARGADFGSAMRDFSMADYQADPGYQFRLEQGEKGLQRAAAAGGMLGSGKYLKDAMKFNSGLASQEYGQAFDRFQVNRSNKLNPLQSMMGAGQTATGALGQAGANYASNVGNNLMGAGNARAAGQVGQANAINGAIGTGWNMYQGSQTMNMLKPQTQSWAPNTGATSYASNVQAPADYGQYI